MDRVRHYALIVAGGKGLRMGGDLPKQFVCIGGRPILMHTLDKFRHCTETILVLPREHQAYWQDLCRRYDYDTPHRIATAGESRFHSVRSGLQLLREHTILSSDLVAVHDGVRPFVDRAVIDRCYEVAREAEVALPYLDMTDSLRHYDALDGGSYAVERSHYVRVQTPQVFRLDKLIRAYEQEYHERFTDDASVWEEAGFPCPKLIRSNTENIKITTPLDLLIAEALLSDL